MTEAIREDFLTISGKKIPAKYCMLPHAQLKFFPENPRIYSIISNDESTPEQGFIEEKLASMDHVKQLVQSITANGGLTDAIIVRDGDFVVLEGNSRLAAYRTLAKSDLAKWGKIKCCLLPKDIEDSLVFALLGQYHIIGRKDWAPYEQAGYLWRRHRHHEVSIDVIAKEMGITKAKVKKLIETYDFMVQHDDVNIQHWSYYDEFLKSRPIKKARAEYSSFDAQFVTLVKSGEIPKAIDVRHKLSKICLAAGKTLKKFCEEAIDFETAYEAAIRRGAGNDLYKSLHRFREVICDPDYKSDLFTMPNDHTKKCVYELEKIHNQIGRLLSTDKNSDK